MNLRRHRRGLAARQRRRVLAAGPDGRGPGRGSPALSEFRGTRLGLGRGALDHPGGDRRGTSGRRAHGRALRALQLARRGGLPEQAALGDALPVRRASREAGEVEEARPKLEPESGSGSSLARRWDGMAAYSRISCTTRPPARRPAAATVAAVAVANSPLAAAYERVPAHRHRPASGQLGFAQSVRHWVNDALMALFFFVVGLEIKRELVVGELSRARRPAADLRGARRHAGPRRRLPGAERRGARRGRVGRADGDRHRLRPGRARAARPSRPAGLKVFLVALAIADDIGAILVIALFYSGQVHGAGSRSRSFPWRRLL